jgi:methylated-DNA-[protein]-cysteine S-methyltransferase
MLGSLFYFMEVNMSDIKYYSEETISEINIAVLASSKGIKKIFFNPAKEITELSTATKLRSDDPYLFGIFNQLKEYFAGTRKEFDVPLDVEGTDFQKKVWNELRNIPYGKTISYKSLSEKLGNVKAIRAVGKANGQNPIAILIPCHRVIGANGSLVGYAGGLAIKEKLLHLEGALNPELFD